MKTVAFFSSSPPFSSFLPRGRGDYAALIALTLVQFDTPFLLWVWKDVVCVVSHKLCLNTGVACVCVGYHVARAASCFFAAAAAAADLHTGWGMFFCCWCLKRERWHAVGVFFPFQLVVCLHSTPCIASYCCCLMPFKIDCVAKFIQAKAACTKALQRTFVFSRIRGRVGIPRKPYYPTGFCLRERLFPSFLPQNERSWGSNADGGLPRSRGLNNIYYVGLIYIFCVLVR